MNEKYVFTPREVSQILRIGMSKTYELLQLEVIPNKKIHKKYLISKLELEKAFNIKIN